MGILRILAATTFRNSWRYGANTRSLMTDTMSCKAPSTTAAAQAIWSMTCSSSFSRSASSSSISSSSPASLSPSLSWSSSSPTADLQQ